MVLSMLRSCAVVEPRCTLVLSAFAAPTPLVLAFVAAPRAVDSPTLVDGKGLLVLSIFMGYSSFSGSIATYIDHFCENFNPVLIYTPTGSFTEHSLPHFGTTIFVGVCANYLA